MTEHEATTDQVFDPARVDHIRAAKVAKHNLNHLGQYAYADPKTHGILLEAILDTQIAVAESSRIVALAAVVDGWNHNHGTITSVEVGEVNAELRDLLGFVEFTTTEGNPS